jgi:hypothetical protein
MSVFLILDDYGDELSILRNRSHGANLARFLWFRENSSYYKEKDMRATATCEPCAAMKMSAIFISLSGLHYFDSRNRIFPIRLNLELPVIDHLPILHYGCLAQNRLNPLVAVRKFALHVKPRSTGPSYDAWVSGSGESDEPGEPSITTTKQGRTPSQEKWSRFLQALNELEESQLDGAASAVQKAHVNRTPTTDSPHRISSGSRRLNP